MELLGHSGLLPQLNVGLGVSWATTEIDFWSYASDLDKRVEEEEAMMEEREKEEAVVLAQADQYAEVEMNAKVPDGAQPRSKEDDLDSVD